MLRIAGFDDFDLNSTDGIAYSIYFQGCGFHCKGCHNPELQPFIGGEMYNVENLWEKIMKETSANYDYITLLGGEPMHQDLKELLKLLELFKGLRKVIMYTGCELKDIPKDILDNLYAIKCGQYMQDLPKGDKYASNNQKFYILGGDI